MNHPSMLRAYCELLAAEHDECSAPSRGALASVLDDVAALVTDEYVRNYLFGLAASLRRPSAARRERMATGAN